MRCHGSDGKREEEDDQTSGEEEYAENYRIMMVSFEETCSFVLNLPSNSSV